MTRSSLRNASQKTRETRWPTLAALRQAVLLRAQGRCEVCRYMRDLDIHHVVKRSQGGADTPDNAVALCRTCHEDTDRPYGQGRLVITPLGEGRFGAVRIYKDSKWATT